MEGLAGPHSHVQQWVSPSAACFSSPDASQQGARPRGCPGGISRGAGCPLWGALGSLCVGVGVVMGLGFLSALCCLAFRPSTMFTQSLLTRVRRGALYTLV